MGARQYSRLRNASLSSVEARVLLRHWPVSHVGLLRQQSSRGSRPRLLYYLSRLQPEIRDAHRAPPSCADGLLAGSFRRCCALAVQG